MSLARTITLVARDIRLGPRSPLLLWAVGMPLLCTFLIQVVFAALLDPLPRLAIADLGHSEITAAIREMDGIELEIVEDAAALRALVEQNDADAGLVLRAGFDEALRTGERPELEFYLSGESQLPHRILLAVTTLDLLRAVEDRPEPVEVVVHSTGTGAALPIPELLTLCLVIFTLLVAGIFVPAFMLVDEREHRTLEAVLVTPASIGEVLLAKALLGFLAAITMSVLTLALNGALGANPLALLMALAISAAVCIEIGLVYGTICKDAKSLYTLMKSLNVFLVAPAVFYFFPDWPQWIAKLFPTYWFIDPLYRIALHGAALSEVWSELAVAAAVAAALLFPVASLGRRLQGRLASH